jgi:hypothetical protein
MRGHGGDADSKVREIARRVMYWGATERRKQHGVPRVWRTRAIRMP